MEIQRGEQGKKNHKQEIGGMRQEIDQIQEMLRVLWKGLMRKIEHLGIMIGGVRLVIIGLTLVENLVLIVKEIDKEMKGMSLRISN